MLAAAEARLREERRMTGAAASQRAAGARPRGWRGDFHAADSVLTRRPHVMRSASHALQPGRRVHPRQHLLDR